MQTVSNSTQDAMKLVPDALTGYSITGYGPGWLAMNGEKTHASVVISAKGYSAWNCTCFEDLQAQHFEQLIELNPELILFGIGERIRFPQPQWLQS